MTNQHLSSTSSIEILTAKDILCVFNGKKSLRWIYDHAKDLGGYKIGGSWIFTREGLENAISRKEQKDLERKSNLSRQTVYPKMQDKKSSPNMGVRKKKRAKEDEADPYGLLTA